MARAKGSAVPFVWGGGGRTLDNIGACVVVLGSGGGSGGGWGVTRGTGSAVPFVGEGGHGHGTAVARSLALGGAGAAGLGPWGVAVAPQGGRGGASERVRGAGAAGSG